MNSIIIDNELRRRENRAIVKVAFELMYDTSIVDSQDAARARARAIHAISQFHIELEGDDLCKERDGVLTRSVSLEDEPDFWED